MAKNVVDTLKGLCRELNSRPNAYCVIAKRSIESPIKSTMRVHHVKINEHSLAISAIMYDENGNKVSISQITDIKKRGNWFVVQCGLFDSSKENVYISLGQPDDEEFVRLMMRMTA